MRGACRNDSCFRAIAPAVVVVLCAAPFALAQPRPPADVLDLAWSAPVPCPSADEVRSGVHQLIGDASPSARPVRAKATAWRGEDTAWHVQIETESAGVKGERKVDGATCRAVTDAAVLILAMAIDPDAVASRMTPLAASAGAPSASSPMPSASVVASAAVSNQPMPVPALVASAAPRASLPRKEPPPVAVPPMFEAVLIAAYGGVDVGTLPSPAPGWGLGLGVASRGWSLEAQFKKWSEQQSSIEAAPQASATIGLWTVGTRACFKLLGTEWASACWGWEGGKLAARGEGVAHPRQASPWWFSVEGGILAQWTIGERFAVHGGVEIAVPLTHRAFEIAPYGTVHSAWPVCIRGVLGPVVKF